MIRVLITDDHPVVREGLAAIFAEDPDIDVVGTAASGEEALTKAERLRPDVAVLDIRLAGISGLETCQRLRTTRPGVRCVMVSASATGLTLRESVAAGAHGFVSKSAGPRALVEAVRAAAEGTRYVDPTLAKLGSGPRRGSRPFGLTLQEIRVLEHLPSGRTNRQIGDQLGITEATVKTHLSHAMKKLGIKTRAAVAALAERGGLM